MAVTQTIPKRLNDANGIITGMQQMDNKLQAVYIFFSQIFRDKNKNNRRVVLNLFNFINPFNRYLKLNFPSKNSLYLESISDSRFLSSNYYAFQKKINKIISSFEMFFMSKIYKVSQLI